MTHRSAPDIIRLVGRRGLQLPYASWDARSAADVIWCQSVPGEPRLERTRQPGSAGITRVNGSLPASPMRPAQDATGGDTGRPQGCLRWPCWARQSPDQLIEPPLCRSLLLGPRKVQRRPGIGNSRPRCCTHPGGWVNRPQSLWADSRSVWPRLTPHPHRVTGDLTQFRLACKIPAIVRCDISVRVLMTLGRSAPIRRWFGTNCDLCRLFCVQGP
jgi:hypothetical protein